jgi:hypothetical protein
MRRREFITLIGSAGVVPLVAGAQPSESMRRPGQRFTRSGRSSDFATEYTSP